MNTFTLSDIKAMSIGGLEQAGFILDEGGADTLDDINFINILIGENSAGKSRFLRAILTRNVNHINIGPDNLRQILEDALSSRENHYKFDVHARNAILEALPYSSLESGLLDWVYDTIENCQMKVYGNSNSSKVQNTARQTLGDSLIEKLGNLKSSCVPTLKLLTNREYIPILRGLRPLDPHKDLFKERTHSDYFSSEKQISKYETFTGYTLYSDLMHSLLGLEEERASVRHFEDYLSEHFFEGKPITLIPKKDREGGKETE